ncbi:MAG: GntR family transcriptional regulator, partial [Planctomycetota bacterium]
MPADNSALIRTMIADLQADLASACWSPGERLPSEQELCERYGTSRYSVRVALKALAANGLVRNRPGRGWERVDEQALRADLVDVLVPAKMAAELGHVLETALAGYGLHSARREDPRVADLGPAAARRLARSCRGGCLVFFEDARVDARVLRILRQEGRALVQVGLSEPAAHDTCCPDNMWSGEQLVAAATAAGHSAIMFIARSGLTGRLASFRQRWQGYCAAMLARGLTPRYLLLDDGHPFDPAAQRACADWLVAQAAASQPPTCLIANLAHMPSLLPELARHGFIPGPGGLSCLGYGSTPMPGFDQLAQPPFTRLQAVSEDWAPVAAAAAARAHA